MFLYLSFNIPGFKIFQNENLGENFIHFIISEQDGNLDHNFLGMGKQRRVMRNGPWAGAHVVLAAP